MRLNEMIGVLLYFDALNGLRRLNSSDSVVGFLSEYREKWIEGFELSVLFDSRFYASQLSPTELEEKSPLEHYLLCGNGNADPHPLIDASFYRNRYERLSWGVPAIIDFAATHSKGERGVRASSPYFDPGYYLSRNPDVAATKVDPLVHFMRFGANEGRAFHPFLDLGFVRDRVAQDSPEVADMSRLELLRYVIAFNVLDRVDPSALFSNRIYRESKVGRIDRNPFYDFMSQTDPYLSGDPAGTFSMRKYVGENPSVNFHFTNAYAHYLTYGAKSSETCDLLSWPAYLEENCDVKDGPIRPLEHLFAHAFSEGRYVSKQHRIAVRRRYARHSSENLGAIKSISEDTAYLFRRPNAPFDAVSPVSIQTLKAASIEALTIDFWDTFVLRSSPHWSPKVHTAKQLHSLLAAARREDNSRTSREAGGSNREAIRRLLAGEYAKAPSQLQESSPNDLYRERIAIEAGLFAEGVEYDFRSVMRRQLRRSAPFGSPAYADEVLEPLIDKLLLAEQDFESTHVTLNRSLLALVEEKLEAGAKVAIVSDFYHDSTFLRRILQSLGVREATLTNLRIFSSCEEGASKLANGALFEKVADALAITDRSQWVHIGDSETSDVRAAYARGITSVHFRSQQGSKTFDLPELSSVEEPVYQRAAFAAFESSVGHAVVGPVSLPHDARHVEISHPLIVQAAQESAMLPVLLVLAALEHAASRGSKQLVYLSREGVFLERIHAAIRSTLGSDLRHVRGIHLKTSRRSLFAPTFAANEAAAVAIFNSQYPTATAKTFLGALLPSELVSRLEPQELHRLSVVTVSELAKAEKLDDVLTKQTLEICRRYAGQQQALFSRYLEQQRVERSSDSDLLLCDIGWRGTMQDMLSAIHPEVSSLGVYLGLFPFHLSQSKNAVKVGIAFDGNAGDSYAHVDPPAAIERTWTPNVGSAIGYASAEPGKVTIRQDEGDCTAVAERNIGAFQDEVLRVAPIVAAEYIRYGLNWQSIRAGLGERVKRYFLEPHPGISELWFSSLHDDTFGLGENPYKKQLPPINEVSNTNLRFLIDAHGMKSRWKEGYRNWPAVQWFDTLLGGHK
jgi:FMN phosphatase YigB (HAD superfamily)